MTPTISYCRPFIRSASPSTSGAAEEAPPERVSEHDDGRAARGTRFLVENHASERCVNP